VALPPEYFVPPFTVEASNVNGPIGQLVSPSAVTVASTFIGPDMVTTPVVGSTVPLQLPVATGSTTAGTMIFVLNCGKSMPDWANDKLPFASTLPFRVPLNGPTAVGLPVTVRLKNALETVTVTLPVGVTTAPAAIADAMTSTTAAIARSKRLLARPLKN